MPLFQFLEPVKRLVSKAKVPIVVPSFSLLVPQTQRSLSVGLLEGLIGFVRWIASLAANVLIWSASYALSVVRWTGTRGLIVLSSAKAHALAVASHAFQFTGLNVVVVTLGSTEPTTLIALQTIFLGLALGFFASSKYYRFLHFFETGKGRFILSAALIVVATGSLIIAILGFPPEYVTRDVSDLSGLGSSPLRLTSADEKEVFVLVPRRSAVKKASVTISSPLVLSQEDLLSIGNKSSEGGYPISQDFSAAFGFNMSSPHAIGGFRLLLSAVKESNAELKVMGFADQRGEPGGLPLFAATVSPQRIGFDPKWIQIDLPKPLLAFGKTRIWIVLETVGDGYYVWWSSRSSEYVGPMLVKMGSGRWVQLRGNPCLTVLQSPTYENHVSLGVGRFTDYWSGSIPAGGTSTIDLTEALGDYLSRSPENFKIVKIPVRFRTSSRVELVFSSLVVRVDEVNPDITYGLISLALASVVALVCTFAFLRLHVKEPGGFSSSAPALRTQPNPWERIE